jgi:hypothetical protein
VARRPAHTYGQRNAAHEPRHYARRTERNYVRTERNYARNERGHVRRGENPVAAAATGAVGAVADLGSIAAYPIYCFPNYGSCRVDWFYRP